MDYIASGAGLPPLNGRFLVAPDPPKPTPADVARRRDAPAALARPALLLRELEELLSLLELRPRRPRRPA